MAKNNQLKVIECNSVYLGLSFVSKVKDINFIRTEKIIIGQIIILKITITYKLLKNSNFHLVD